jgi:hypothetical protein
MVCVDAGKRNAGMLSALISVELDVPVMGRESAGLSATSLPLADQFMTPKAAAPKPVRVITNAPRPWNDSPRGVPRLVINGKGAAKMFTDLSSLAEAGAPLGVAPTLITFEPELNTK